MVDDLVWKDIQPYAYFDKGLYARQLKRYLEFFDLADVYVLNNESLGADPSGEVRKVLRFLDVPFEQYRHVENSPRFPSFQVRSRSIQRMIRHLHRPLLERAIMKKRSGQRATIFERLAQLNMTDGRAPLDPAVAERLRGEYADEMSTLRRLTGVEMSEWNI